MYKKIIILFTIFLSSFLLLSCKHEDDNYEWFVKKLNMTMINNIDTSNVTIAILDTGYHKEVINKYERNITEKYNFIEHSQNVESEVNYHASNIMSLILGDIDVYGYSNNAKVIPIVVADDYGHTSGTLLSEGIYYAVNNHAQLICISLGSYVDYDSVKNAINYALNNNSIVIAASGDKGIDRVMFPAAYDGVYAVSSQKSDGELLENANYITKSIKLPGEAIKVINYIEGNNYYYIYTSGSSYSTAIFSCLACCILNFNNYDIFKTKDIINNISYDEFGFLKWY